MHGSHVDPGLYFKPYTHQLRAFAVQYASGQPIGTEHATFRVPRYYTRAQTSDEIGTHFESGLNVPDPVGYQRSLTFFQAYASSENLQRRYMEDVAARAAVPQHINLETPSGQDVKNRLNLPYESHSRIDIFKAVEFGGLRHIQRVFSYNTLDSLVSRGLDGIASNGYVRGVLEGTNRSYQTYLKYADASIRKNPVLHSALEQMAVRESELSEEIDPFVRAFDKLQGATARMLGASVPLNPEVNPVELRFTRSLLKNVAGPGLLLGLQVGPLLREIGHKLGLGHHRHKDSEEAREQSERHHNLETPTGKMLKVALDLPYKAHSQVDPQKAAEFFSKVRQAFRETFTEEPGAKEQAEHFNFFPKIRRALDRLETEYPNIVGQPRQVLRAIYELQTNAYAHLAQHNNVVVSTLARSLLYAERVEHKFDYAYRFSPSRMASRMFRAFAGVEKRDYETLALDGLKSTNLRRVVKLAGLGIGVIETILRYEKLIDEWRGIRQKYFPDKDPDQVWEDKIDKVRRRMYDAARRRNQRFDPTSTARTQKRTPGAFKDLIQEFREQISPKHQVKAFLSVFQHPRDHTSSLAAYGTYAALAGITLKKTLEHTAGEAAVDRFLHVGGELFERHATHMQRAAAAFGIAGILTGKSWTARTGALSNLLATVGADITGDRLGRWFVGTEEGRKWAATSFRTVSNLRHFFEINNPSFNIWSDRMAGYADSFSGQAGTSVEREAVEAATKVAGKVGMEIAGILLEGSFLIPIRHGLHKLGQKLDHAERFRRVKKKTKQRVKEARHQETSDYWLRQFLLSYSAPAFSDQDFYLNDSYRNPERLLGLALRRNERVAQVLDTAGVYVTKWRRIQSAVNAVRTTQSGERRPQEDWRNRLYRAQVAPAYSDRDIASNPMYTVPERLFLAAARHTEKGSSALDQVSIPVTNYRKAKAWIDGLSHHDELADHLGKHFRHAAHHKTHETTHASPVIGAYTDSIEHTVKSAQMGYKAAKKHLRVKVRTHSKDVPLNEKSLHEAYSRYINYGHEGNTLQQDDSL